jgi:hypothetical protein
MQIDKEKSHIMSGIKLSFNSNQSSRYFIDIEGLYKQSTYSKIENVKLSNTGKYKFDMSIGLELSKNLVLSATIGKDFGSEIYKKSGSLFTFLNLVGGIGRSDKDI